VLSYLQLPELLLAAKVHRQWRDLHAADENFAPLYRLAYGDSLRLNEQRDWKWNFRARDMMLAKLGPAIAQLAHPERERRTESVTFLRSHCEMLRFMLDPPQGMAPPATTAASATAAVVSTAALAAAAATAVAPPLPQASVAAFSSQQQAEDTLMGSSSPPVAVPVAMPVHLDGSVSAPAAALLLPVARAVAPGPHPADADHVAAVAAPVPPVPQDAAADAEFAEHMYARPLPPPPSFGSSGGRPALPARHSLEFQHAQHLIKDALVNQGWRKLYPLLVRHPSSARRMRTPTPGLQLVGSDATSLPHATSSFPFAAAAAAAVAAASSTSATATSATAFSCSDDSSSAAMADTNTPSSRSPSSFENPFSTASPELSPETDDASPSTSSFCSSTSSSSSYRSPFPDADRSIEYGAVLIAWTEHPWLRFEAVSRALDDIALLVVARMEAIAVEENAASDGAAAAAAASSSSTSSPNSTSSSSARVRMPCLPLHLRLQALHHVLYTQLGFHGNEARYYDVRNSFIHLVLRSRTGIPISLAGVYMAVATRVGIQAQGVNSPGHFLLRVVEDTAPATAPTSVTAHSTATSTAHKNNSTPNDSGGLPHSNAAPAAASQPPPSSVYFIDAFSGHMMSPSMTLNFLSMFGDGGGASDEARLAQLQPCSPAHIFVRMYRNLLNLYQYPSTTQQATPEAAAADDHGGGGAAPPPQTPQQRATAAYYNMEARLHHCASQILELLRLGGEAAPDVATAIFIDRFKFCGGMS
jgi:regulator of sirC expression with transglutaminase-like and TPR domain